MTQKLIPKINPVSPEYELQVADAIFRIKFDLFALASYQEATGRNPAFAGGEFSLMEVAVLLFAGLQANHPDLELATVIQWFTPATAEALCAATWEAFKCGMPSPTESEKGAPQNPPMA